MKLSEIPDPTLEEKMEWSMDICKIKKGRRGHMRRLLETFIKEIRG